MWAGLGLRPRGWIGVIGVDGASAVCAVSIKINPACCNVSEKFFGGVGISAAGATEGATAGGAECMASGNVKGSSADAALAAGTEAAIGAGIEAAGISITGATDAGVAGIGAAAAS